MVVVVVVVALVLLLLLLTADIKFNFERRDLEAYIISPDGTSLTQNMLVNKHVMLRELEEAKLC